MSMAVSGFRHVVLVVTALLLAAIPFVLVIGALRDPTKSLHGMLGSALWTTIGLHLLLVSLLAHLPITSTTNSRRTPWATKPEDLLLCVT